MEVIMSGIPTYRYASGDLLENRNTYFYTSYEGQAFLESWRRQRTAALAAACGTDSESALPDDCAPVARQLQRLKKQLAGGSASAGDYQTLDRLLQRFEVSKRLHDSYSSSWKPLDTSRYHGAERYLLLAEALCLAAANTGDLRYLNGLLKCVDTLTATGIATGSSGSARLNAVLEQERHLVDQVAARPPGTARCHAMPALPQPLRHPVVMKGIGMIAAATARSQAYIQALAACGLHPEFVLLLGDHATSSAAAPLPRTWRNVQIVDLAESVPDTCRRAGIPAHSIPAASVNDSAALEAIQRLHPKTLIYSGAGGQIVSREALGLGARFLHLHAGHIPGYRGSTTIYYALLNKEQPSVTAIFLDENIDTGGILSHQAYPDPNMEIDIDRSYDASIRADCLVRLLHDYAASGSFRPPQAQSPDEGATYFVIHPVLKHLAILGLPEHGND
jgi:methionyl-tRNA formyltransferase